MADTKLSKSAGEHHVCSELARRGWGASLTRDGLERTDILAVHPELDRRPRIEVQVKAMRGKPNWLVGSIALKPPAHGREWCALVFLPDLGEAPATWLVPRAHLGAAVWLAHRTWLNDPTAKRERRASIEQARVSAKDLAGYTERWDLLEQPTDDVVIRLPQRLQDAIKPEGLPPNHPWTAGLPAWEPVESP